MKICTIILYALSALLSVAGAPPARLSAVQNPPADASVFTVDDVLDLAALRIADQSEDGRWLAVTSATLRDRIGIDNYRYGDPSYIAPSLSDLWVIDTRTEESRRLFPDKVQVQSLKWSRNGEYLAFLLLRDGLYRPMIWERRNGAFHPVTLPPDRHAVTNTELEWAPAGDRLFMSLRPADWREQAARRFQQETQGPIVFHSSREPFLAWDEIRRISQQRIVAAYDTATGQTREVLGERRINSYHFDRDAGLITYYEDITQKTDYDVIGGATSKVQVQSLDGGEPRTVLESTKDRRIIWSRNGRHYAYAEKGDLYFGSVDDGKPRQLTGKREAGEKAPPEAAGRKPDDESKPEEKETYSPVRLSPDGDSLVASNKKGFWMIRTADGAKELFIERDEEDTEAPRYDLIDWDPAGGRVYLSRSAREKWERGVVRYHVAEKKMEELLRDGRGYSNFTLSLDGSTFVFLRWENNRPADLCVADSDFRSVRRLMEGNPHLAGKRLPKAELVSYLNTDGKKLYGVLYYPVDYVEGRKYPTVFNIYEDFFDDRFNGTICLLNSHGYAVMQPSVTFQTGFPGEAWLKSVTCAANKLIEMGIADPDRLGVYGTSYGGYATNLLITQTDRFKAAINISGKVNMVSFYTDSPRLGVRNIHAPEKSQDRIGATLWQQPHKYIEHSAVMFADRIKTPLLLMTGEQDANVPARQAMEMYYALRRLDKEVAWVQYIDGGHGMPTTTVEEVKDYHRRILEWYDSHLKGDLKKKEKTGSESG